MTGLKKLSSAIALMTTALAGCSGTGGTIGDPPSKPAADQNGSGARLSDLIGPAPWVDPLNKDSIDCAYPADKNIHVTGVAITAIDRFDETGTGAVGTFFVQDLVDSPPPYSGVDVFSPSFSPPDLRLQVGDQADILGTLQEFPGPTTFIFPRCKTLPEIGGTMTFRSENKNPAPVTIALEDLKSYDTARQWLGMLVRVENVTIAAKASSKGRFTADIDAGGGGLATDIPQIANELYDIEKEGPMMAQGTTFKSVTGIVTFFSQFQLAPRSAADFEQ